MPIVEHYAKNTVGRDFIVGDIHGHFSKLQADLDKLKFNPAVDRLFSVGDLVDRGPESDLATDWLDKPWFHAVMGNHEWAAVLWAAGEIPQDFYVRGYSAAWNVMNPKAEQVRLADRFSAMPLMIELETDQGRVGIVHADCPINDWDEVKRVLEVRDLRAKACADCCLEGRERANGRIDGDVRGVRAVVVGHQPFDDMTSLDNVIYIDTRAWRGGKFTILDAATLRRADPPPVRTLDWSS